jgi:UDP-2-acetamido-3-amino-2,3-dideoxy-glucuronate N-acetyltransferase
MTQETLSVGVVGAGYWGKNLLRNFHNIGALKAFCDSNQEAVDAYAAQYTEVQSYTDYAQLLASDIQAVAIATPAETHEDLVRQALEAGKHVFVEKPLCLNAEKAEELKAYAEREGLTLMVGHLLLYHPAFQALLALVRSGSLGKINYIYSNRLNLGKIRREENALWSFAPHDVSMILQIANAMPEQIVATGGHYLTPGIADTTLTHMSFPDNVQAHIFVSWLHPYKDQLLVVVGDSGMVVFNDKLQGPEKLELYRHSAGWDGDVPVVSKAEAEPIPYGEGEPLRLECNAFIRAVTEGVQPPSDAAEGIRVLRVLDASQRAITAGHPIRL